MIMIMRGLVNVHWLGTVRGKDMNQNYVSIIRKESSLEYGTAEGLGLKHDFRQINLKFVMKCGYSLR